MDADYRALRCALRRAARAAGAPPQLARRQPRQLAWWLHRAAYVARYDDAARANVLASLADLAWLVGTPRPEWSWRSFDAWLQASGDLYRGLARSGESPLLAAFLAARRAAFDAAYSRRV